MIAAPDQGRASMWKSTVKLIYAPAEALVELGGLWLCAPAVWIMVTTSLLTWAVQLPATLSAAGERAAGLRAQGQEIPVGLTEGMKIGTVVGAGTTAAMSPLITCFLIAGLLWVAERFTRKQLGFSRLFSVATWSTMPAMAVRQLVALPLAAVGVPFRTDLQCCSRMPLRVHRPC